MRNLKFKMEILFCVNKDIYCLYSLNQIFKSLSDHQIKIYFSNQVGSKPINNKTLKELQVLEKDLSTRNIADLFNLETKDMLELDDLLQLNNVEVLNFNNINQDGAEYLSTKWTPDLIISIRFGQIFKDKVIALPKLGIVNLHSGILPYYQGILATFWTMKDKQKEIGCTLHFIEDSSIDSGDIIEISRITADYKKPLITNIFSLYKSGSKMIINFLKNIKDNSKINKIPQNKKLAHYFSYPNESDIESSKINFI